MIADRNYTSYVISILSTGLKRDVRTAKPQNVQFLSGIFTCISCRAT